MQTTIFYLSDCKIKSCQFDPYKLPCAAIFRSDMIEVSKERLCQIRSISSKKTTPVLTGTVSCGFIKVQGGLIYTYSFLVLLFRVFPRLSANGGGGQIFRRPLRGRGHTWGVQKLEGGIGELRNQDQGGSSKWDLRCFSRPSNSTNGKKNS